MVWGDNTINPHLTVLKCLRGDKSTVVHSVCSVGVYKCKRVYSICPYKCVHIDLRPHTNRYIYKRS